MSPSEIKNLPPEAMAEIRQRSLSEAAAAFVAEALKSPDSIVGLKAWRDLDNLGPLARKTRRFFDARAAEKRASALPAVLPKAVGRVEELLAAAAGYSANIKPEVTRVLSDLSAAKSTEGAISVVDLLSSDKTPLKTKAEWFRSHFLPALNFLQSRDLADARRVATVEVEENPLSEPNLIPPSSSDSLSPSMDEMEKGKEGESRGWFMVRPFFGGYYRGDDFEKWDAVNLCWRKGARKFTEETTVTVSGEPRRVMNGSVNPGRTDLPMPYGFVPDVSKLSSGDLQILSDGRGGYFLENFGDTVLNFSLELVSADHPIGGEAGDCGFGDFILSEGTETFLKTIKSSGCSEVDCVRAVKQFVRKKLEYSNKSAMNVVYRSGDPNGYFLRIEQNKKADCDVANTYFIALLSKIGIKARLVSGHYVKIKDRAGAAVLSAETAHVWCEVWVNGEWLTIGEVWVNSEWSRKDATPPGDPNMDEEETDEKIDNENNDGDFGEQEIEEISDKKLSEMMKKAEEEMKRQSVAVAEAKKEPAAKFAEAAGCSVEEARKVMAQMEAARGLRDKSGRLISERLADEFRKIIQENTVERLRYVAPVRMSESDDLDDPVAAWIDMKTGSTDPIGFARYRREVKREQVYGGFDVIFVVDKSGSMDNVDPSSGAVKWQDQQKFVFLFLDSLFAAAEELRRQKIKMIGPIDIRIGLVSFAAGGARVELPLSEGWQEKEQLAVWRSLQNNIGGGTPDHLGLSAAQEMLKSDQEENRLQLVLVSADGGSDNVAATLRVKEALKKSGAVVKAAGIGVGTEAVRVTYYPDGANLSSFSEVAAWAAEHVIDGARKLFPKKVKK